jgi:hypothetical protein
MNADISMNADFSPPKRQSPHDNPQNLAALLASFLSTFH